MAIQSSERLGVGLDVGFGNIKSYWGDGDLLYPARAKLIESELQSNAHSLLRKGNSLDEVRVTVDGQSYLVGPDTHLHVPEPMVADDYCVRPEYKAHVIGALHYMFRKTGVLRRTIPFLALGLPVSNFAFRRDQLKEGYEGRTLIVPVPEPLQGAYGRTIEVRIEKLYILPQPVGSLVAWATDLKQLGELHDDRNNLVIDPGERTFDWYAARGTKPIYEESGAIPGGKSSIVYKLVDRMTKDLGTFVDYRTAEQALKREEISIVGVGLVNMRPYHMLARELAAGFVDHFMKRVGSGSFDNVVLAGGGLTLFEEALRKRFPAEDIRTVSNPIMANARGFYLWGTL
ncbi:ParM/StbA family protein (plasmid) [Cupriavidus basilensis]